MALKQTKGIAERLSGTRAMPVVRLADLEAQRQSPGVKARLERVKAQIEARAQQKV